ncbi:hypothetical protein PanWU01x14_206140 [Parasponia andersonii]|uniref:Uncharacterized protein n=1 Tax=Parasponia andersonii TaxID=3476 RepID=A0A2P5BVX9_PARAD|nr:hypothetical protein PanWU01x14_206140 [Parasponia andersonii]
MAFTKANPYKHVPLDQWSILCDCFGFDEFERNPDTREPMSPIDYFESRHLKSTGWRNEYIQEKHAEMVTSKKGLRALPRLKSVEGPRAASTGQVIEIIATLKQQLAEKDVEHARQIDDTQRL